MKQVATQDTIFAIATPPGVGGVGIIRVSGPETRALAQAVVGRLPAPRLAAFHHFLDAGGEAIDSGIVLFFPAPASLTGEDVLELQGHGGPVVQQLLSARLAELGARPARPGEFLQRAYLNDKIDLAQAEAIADLIESGTAAAARAAQRSLDGVFSERVHRLLEGLTGLRVFIEAALDFPEDEIDFIAESDVVERLQTLIDHNDRLTEDAHQGILLRDGITIAIFGQPNAGKSSLLNALSGRAAAIVTNIPGTTRDVLRESLSLQGVPVHIADTAGIREAGDVVEAEGVRRARAELQNADLALLVIDGQEPLEAQRGLLREVPESVPVLEVINKTDLDEPGTQRPAEPGTVCISALTGQGIGQLVASILDTVGALSEHAGQFSARTRHIDALKKVREHLVSGREQLTARSAPEVLAEELRLAQGALGEITGEYLPDDLLGAIFSSFCIGK